MTRRSCQRYINVALALALLFTPLLALAPSAARAQFEVPVVVTTVDENGAPLVGACFAVVTIGPSTFGSYPVCDDDDGLAPDGVVSLYSVPDGDEPFSLFLVTAPEGFQVGGRTQVEPVEGQSVAVQVALTPGGESVVVTTADGDGDPVRGACVDLVRDNGIRQRGLPVASGCAPEGSDDEIRIGGVPPGTYLLVGANAEGAFFGDSTLVDVTVKEGEEATAEAAFSEFSSTGELGEGSLTITMEDDAGEPVLGLCVYLTWVDAPEEDFRSFGECDRNDESAGAGMYESDGVVLVDGLPDGTFTFDQPTLPAGFAASKKLTEIVVEDGSAEQKTLKLKRGGQSLTIEFPPALDGEQPYTCAIVSEPVDETVVAEETADDEEPTPRWGVSACSQADANGTYADSVSVAVIAAELVVTLDRTLDGYAPIPEQTIRVGRDEAATLEFDPAEEGLIEVSLVNEDGKPLGVGCLAAFAAIDDLYDGLRLSYGIICDSNDGLADGTVTFNRLPAGTFDIVPVAMPRSRQLPAPVQLEVTAGETTEATLVSPKGGGRAAITLADADPDQPSLYGCIVLHTVAEPDVEAAFACDSFDDDPDDRVVSLAGLPAGDYLVDVFVNPRFPTEVEFPTASVTVVDGESVEASLAIPTPPADDAEASDDATPAATPTT